MLRHVNTSRPINLFMIVIPKDYLHMFPSVYENMCKTYSSTKQKYFAPIEMLYNTFKVQIQYHQRNLVIAPQSCCSLYFSFFMNMLWKEICNML